MKSCLSQRNPFVVLLMGNDERQTTDETRNENKEKREFSAYNLDGDDSTVCTEIG